MILKDSTIHTGILSDHLLQQIAVVPKGIELPSRPTNYHSTDWFTYIVFFSLFLFIIAKRTSEKYIPLLFRSITNFSLSSKLFREQNISFMQGSAIMEIFYLLVLGLFGFQVLKYFGLSLPFSGFISFILILGILIFFFLVKLLLYRSLGFLSETLPDTNEYLFNMKNHNKVLGILLFAVVSFPRIPVELYPSAEVSQNGRPESRSTSFQHSVELSCLTISFSDIYTRQISCGRRVSLCAPLATTRKVSSIPTTPSPG